jgi:hypothetical protein
MAELAREIFNSFEGSPGKICPVELSTKPAETFESGAATQPKLFLAVVPEKAVASNPTNLFTLYGIALVIAVSAPSTIIVVAIDNSRPKHSPREIIFFDVVNINIPP